MKYELWLPYFPLGSETCSGNMNFGLKGALDDCVVPLTMILKKPGYWPQEIDSSARVGCADTVMRISYTHTQNTQDILFSKKQKQCIKYLAQEVEIESAFTLT